ncbi:MAG: ATPase, partial [Bacteroidota bacterium]
GGFGFILGDEGSGGVLGKQLMSDYLHKAMPNHLWQKLQENYKLSPNLILDKVYRQSYPNRFLAAFAPFIHQNIQEIYMKTLIKTHFQSFFDRKVLCYEQSLQLPIHFTGSIAHYFQQLLKEVAESNQLQIGNIVQHPIEGLIRYHQKKMN